MILGCARKPDYRCQDSTDCVGSEGQGVCQPAGFCSFADSDCASGLRYPIGSGELSRLCVGEEPDPDRRDGSQISDIIDGGVSDASANDAGVTAAQPCQPASQRTRELTRGLIVAEMAGSSVTGTFSTTAAIESFEPMNVTGAAGHLILSADGSYQFTPGASADFYEIHAGLLNTDAGTENACLAILLIDPSTMHTLVGANADDPASWSPNLAGGQSDAVGWIPSGVHTIAGSDPLTFGTLFVADGAQLNIGSELAIAGSVYSAGSIGGALSLVSGGGELAGSVDVVTCVGSYQLLAPHHRVRDRCSGWHAVRPRSSADPARGRRGCRL